MMARGKVDPWANMGVTLCGTVQDPARGHEPGMAPQAGPKIQEGAVGRRALGRYPGLTPEPAKHMREVGMGEVFLVDEPHLFHYPF